MLVCANLKLGDVLAFNLTSNKVDLLLKLDAQIIGIKQINSSEMLVFTYFDGIFKMDMKTGKVFSWSDSQIWSLVIGEEDFAFQNNKLISFRF